MGLNCASDLTPRLTVTHVDDDNSLVQIWKVKFGHKVKFLFRQDFEAEVWPLFCC